MLRYRAALCTVVLVLLASACDSGRHSSAGFRLPADGSIDRGKVAFVAFECHSCHEVQGMDFPEPTAQPRVPVKLGGQIPRQMTDGYLVSAIINPSHVVVGQPRSVVTLVDGRSRMPEFAERITVRELTDIVAFLQSQYQYYPVAAKAPPGC